MRPSVLFMALPGCVLLVHPAEYGEHCGFQGRDTTCGQCVALGCAAEMDACCGDDACAATVTAVEGCASRRDGTCDAVIASATPVGQCIAQRCRGQCAPMETESPTACHGVTGSNGTACVCTASSSPSGFSCGEAAFPETICCAPAGWPGPGLECSCLPVRCQPSTDGCACTRVDYNVEQSKVCSGGNHCCAAEDICTCHSGKCERSERDVPSCSRSEVACPNGQTQLPSCLL